MAGPGSLQLPWHSNCHGKGKGTAAPLDTATLIGPSQPFPNAAEGTEMGVWELKMFWQGQVKPIARGTGLLVL